MRLPPLKALWALPLCVTSCAIGPGEPFATVHPAIEARFRIPEDRDVGDGFARLSSDFEVRLTQFALGITDVELRAAPIDDENAELDTVLSLPVGRALQLLPGESFQAPCEPDCGLEETHVSEVRAGVDSILIQGVVRDGRAQKRFQGEVPFSLELTTRPLSEDPGSTLQVATDLVANRSEPSSVDLRVDVAPPPEIFDDVDWAAQTRVGGVIDLAAQADPAARTRVLERLGAESLKVEIHR